MTNHFLAIGIPISSREDMQLEISKAAVTATTIRCRNGHYLRWTSEQGAELWIQVDEHNNGIGVTPYFQGKARMTVALTKKISRQADTPLEGAIHGWAAPENDNPESGAYPFVFDLVDKGVYDTFDFPFISPIQLCAFTHELSIYDSEEEYKNSKEDISNLAPEAFIPSGLFRPGGVLIDPPESIAIIAGHILEASELLNPLTNRQYHWMHIKTFGGEIDIVSELELIHKHANIGGIISGQFWLCGKILEPKYKQNRNPLKRLFGK
jgi:hypothetical protein